MPEGEDESTEVRADGESTEVRADGESTEVRADGESAGTPYGTGQVAPAGPVGTATSETTGVRANRRKVREGTVVSDAMEATVVVAVVERVRHPRYRKTVQRTKRLYVHDGDNSAKVGDRVRVVETRPVSKLKRWRLAEILERAR
jgi:small subunit ribosomal protein S17